MIRLMSIWGVFDADGGEMAELVRHYDHESISPYPVEGILDQDLLIFGDSKLATSPGQVDGRYMVLWDAGTYDGDAHAFMKEHPDGVFQGKIMAFIGHATMDGGKVSFVGNGSKLFKTVTKGIVMKFPEQVGDHEVQEPTWWDAKHG